MGRGFLPRWEGSGGGEALPAMLDCVETDVVELIATMVARRSTRDAIALFACCSAMRCILLTKRLGVLRVSAGAARTLVVPMFATLAIDTTLDGVPDFLRFTFRGTSTLVPHEIFLSDEVVRWRTYLAQNIIGCVLSGKPVSHDTDFLETHFLPLVGKVESWSGYGRYLALFQSHAVVSALQEAVTRRQYWQTSLNDVAILIRIPSPSGKIARLTTIVSFCYRFHREAPGGMRDNNDYDDYLAISDFRMHAAGLLMSSVPV